MKRFIVFMLAFVIVTLSASWAFAVVYGEDGYEFEGYDEDSAWEIDSVATLIKVRNDINNGTITTGRYYKLTADLDISSYTDWKPIGKDDSYPFKGFFDGQNHTVTVNFTANDKDITGLFGVIDTGMIKNISVAGNIKVVMVNNSNTLYAGGLAARLDGGTIKNVSFAGNIGGAAVVNQQNVYIGGIIGYAEGTITVDGCKFDGKITISGSSDYNHYCGGGIIGYLDDSYYSLYSAAITNNSTGSLNSGTIIKSVYNAMSTGHTYAGGIIGHIYGSSSQTSVTGNYSRLKTEAAYTDTLTYGHRVFSRGTYSKNTEVDPDDDPTPAITAPTITTSSLPAATVGTAYSATLTATGDVPITWTFSGLPAGLTASAQGVISGTPTASGTFSVTATATNSGGTNTKTLTLTVSTPAPVITPPSITTDANLGTFTAGNSLSIQLSATGGTPITWSASGLPGGLTLDSAGKISGTITAAGTYSFTVTATNTGGSNSRTFTLTVNTPVTPPAITTDANLGTFTAGNSVSIQLSATGNTPITWTANNLPSGLVLNTSGLLSGAIATAGTYSFTVTATNAGGNDSRTFTLTVNTPVTPPAITTDANLGTFTAGNSISIQLSATGNTPITWSADNLPSGLVLNTSGLLSGAIATAGTYSFTVTATNTGGSNSRTFTLTVNIPVTPPAITTGENLGTYTAGNSISIQLAATGDTPITWSASGLPGGLTVDSAGKISGTVTAAGTYSFTVTATNAGGNNSRTFTLTVTPVVTAPTITTEANLGTFKTGDSISIQLAATGDNPITWSASGLPGGLALDSAGKISGTITAVGIYSFTVTATNAGGNNSRTFTLTVEVNAVAPSITTTSINGGKTGTSYTATFTATGSDPITWTAGGLPEGFSMSESGTLSGTTETAGTYTITVTASNSAGSDTKEYTLTIEETIKVTPPSITTEFLPSATEGQPYSEQITADGIGITWSNSGGLPAGLSFSKDGILSGTPEKSGTFRVTLVAKNSAGVDSKIFTLTIESGTISGAAPVIKTSKLPDGFMEWDYNYQLEAEGTVTAWEISDPQNFPAGLELNETTGEITGNISTSKAKTFKFKVIAYNGSTGSKAKTLSLKVISKKPGFKTEDIKAAKWGSKYSFTMKLSNFKATAWSIVGDIPEGLTFDKGKFTGKPLEVGEFEVSITASNGAVDIEDDFILKVNGIAPKLKGSLKSGKENTYYECILKATGTTPIEWEFGNENGEGTLPEGLSWIQSETGDSCKIYGTPEQAFSQRVIITLTNGDNEADSITKSLKMTIKAVKPKFKTKAKDVPAGKTGEDYEYQIELDTKATPFAVEWEYSGEMPNGLYFEEGLIYGIPSEAGNFPITITARNANNTTYKTTLRITLKITENKTALPEETTASEDSRPEFVNGIAYYERGEIRTEILARAVNAGEIIAAVLPAIEVEECGMYEFTVSLDKAAPEGSVMVWHSYPGGEDDSNDKDNAIFLDSDGEVIETVPANYTVTVGAWLEPGVIYEPVITVKR